MGWLITIVYALLSGFTEFLPVSSKAHQLLFTRIFGMEANVPVLNLFVHLAELAAVLMCTWPMLSRLKRSQNHRRRPGNRRVHIIDYDNKLIKSAAMSMLILLLLCFTDLSKGSLVFLAVTSLIGGGWTLITEHMRHANKDSRHMSGLDGIALGIFGGLSFLPGISRNGAIIGYSVARGAERKNAINWAILLSIPALMLLILGDFTSIFSGAAEAISFGIIVSYLLAAVTAFFAGYLAIQLLRFMANKIEFIGFGYYSFGIALLSLFIYLIA